MRGEGTPVDVRRSTAAFRDWRSCTSLFHHEDTETRRKTNERGELRKRASVYSEFRVALPQAGCRALLGLDGRGARPYTQPQPHTTPAVSCFIFSA